LLESCHFTSSVYDKGGESSEITLFVESRQIARTTIETKKISDNDSMQGDTGRAHTSPLLDLPTVLLNGLMSFLCLPELVALGMTASQFQRQLQAGNGQLWRAVSLSKFPHLANLYPLLA
jgi:hypothetical protein